MKFKEILSKLHNTQKLKWLGGGDITGKEFTVRDLKNWNDEGEYSLVGGDLSLALDGRKVFIIKSNLVLFKGILEFV